LFERSEGQYRRVLDEGPEPLRVEALLRLAYRKRRAGDYAAAAELWRQAADSGDWRARRALAVYHEHRRRDLDAALDIVEQALRELGGVGAGGRAGASGPPPGLERVANDLQRRRRRLLLKRQRGGLA
jgi:tetratricopeptide (TPR) repeat protein